MGHDQRQTRQTTTTKTTKTTNDSPHTHKTKKDKVNSRRSFLIPPRILYFPAILGKPCRLAFRRALTLHIASFQRCPHSQKLLIIFKPICHRRSHFYPSSISNTMKNTTFLPFIVLAVLSSVSLVIARDGNSMGGKGGAKPNKMMSSIPTSKSGNIAPPSDTPSDSPSDTPSYVPSVAPLCKSKHISKSGRRRALKSKGGSGESAGKKIAECNDKGTAGGSLNSTKIHNKGTVGGSLNSTENFNSINSGSFTAGTIAATACAFAVVAML